MAEAAYPVWHRSQARYAHQARAPLLRSLHRQENLDDVPCSRYSQEPADPALLVHVAGWCRLRLRRVGPMMPCIKRTR